MSETPNSTNADANEPELSPEEIEAKRINEAVASFKHTNPVTEEELSRLGEDTKALRDSAGEMNKKRGPSLIRDTGKEDKSWQRFAGAGVQLGAAIALFTLGGQWLDERWATAPTFTAIGALLGCGGGMWAVIAAVNATEKKQKKAKSERKDAEASRKEEA